MPQVLDDFPFAGKAVENQGRGVAADARSAMLIANEELRHSKVCGLFAGRWNARPRDQRESDGVAPFENQQWVGLIVEKPVREDFVLVLIARAEHRK